jgi:hypothetical protein
MAETIVLTTAEFAALSAANGSRNQTRMPPEMERRLRELRLIERREWPNGPLWRTAAGDRMREGK